MTQTKTCKQRWLSARTGRWVEGYRPHVVPEYNESGYATCSACGREVYVGLLIRTPSRLPKGSTCAHMRGDFDR